MAYGVCGFTRTDFFNNNLWWNEKMDQRWGFQDNDIYDRSKALLKIERTFLPGMRHLWHPTTTEYLERYYGKLPITGNPKENT